MNAFIDWKDWVGGYPFEVATPVEIKSYLSEKNFTSRKSATIHTLGCNKFVFEKRARSTSTTGKRQHELQSSEISTTELRT